MPTISQGRYAFLALLLGLLPMLMPLSVDGSVALMPAVATYFSVGIEPVQMSMSSLVLGVAVGQLVYGPLSDRYGRKPIILFGIVCDFLSPHIKANNLCIVNLEFSSDIEEFA